MQDGKTSTSSALSRREFFQTSAAAAAALAALGTSPLRAFAGAAVGTPDSRLLVVVQLAGGNDGLNTVVPFADPFYRKLRRTIALTDPEVLRLNDKLALHGAMTKLRQLFAENRVAIVSGVGYPKHSRSHFDATAVWQTARLDPYRSPAGWLGRTLDGTRTSKRAAMPGVGVGIAGLTPAFQASRSGAASLRSLEAFTLMPDRLYPKDAPTRKATLMKLYGLPGKGGAAERFIREVGQSALRLSDDLGAVATRFVPATTYPQGPFGDQLKLVAQIVSAQLGTRVFHVTHGGFDTHSNQKNRQRALLDQLSQGVAALLEDARAHGWADKLAILTYSEFGRRAGENGSGGTDHGRASPLFLVGDKVAGGLYGPAPDMGKLVDGDIPVAVDFRTVYGAVLRDWLGVNPEPILGGRFAPLTLFRA